jgi:hypothetical protein
VSVVAFGHINSLVRLRGRLRRLPRA